MENRLNRPRVFLSHSKTDSSFIEQLHSDLRKCQIDPWLDSEEIRHGKPWLDAIFEDGISMCDAVFVYFTHASLESAMVRKEMDAGILQQLKDQRIAFLPYVSDEVIRSKLRADIQALHVPVWNTQNYESLLPRVVAEIWRSFLERALGRAVQEERVKRLQAELDLEKLRKESLATVFTFSEEAEFSYIWDKLNSLISLEVQERIEEPTAENKTPQLRPGKSYKLTAQLNTIIALLVGAEGYEYSHWKLESLLKDQIKEFIVREKGEPCKKVRFELLKSPEVLDHLMMYGLIDRIHEAPPLNEERIFLRMHTRYRHAWAQKSYRFKYWLAYHNRLPSRIEFSQEIQPLAS